MVSVWLSNAPNPLQISPNIEVLPTNHRSFAKSSMFSIENWIINVDFSTEIYSSTMNVHQEITISQLFLRACDTAKSFALIHGMMVWNQAEKFIQA
jgi:hypothetical protein